MTWEDAIVDLEADQASRIVEAAEEAAAAVRVGYAAEFHSADDRRQFYTLLREMLPTA